MYQAEALPAASPESQGVASSAILAFVEAAEHLPCGELHSVLLARHGRQIAAGWWHPYAPEYPHMLYSLSKSFTATAIGLLLEDGKISLDDLVLDYFLAEAPPDPSEHLRAMRVRHLLSMSTGHAADALPNLDRRLGESWMRAFLSAPVVFAPGTHFLYNTSATYMLSAIVQRRTGQRLLEYLRPRLFGPLGIEHPTWEQSPEGIDTGGFGLNTTTADIARFGQLYLQQGRWQGRQLLPEAWVREATTCQIANGEDAENDWQQGYGYQFWRCRQGAYRGDGAFGQFCLVLPEQDAVLAITAGLEDMQSVLNLVWQHLLPAMVPEPLSENTVASDVLRARLASLRLRPVAGAGTSPLASLISGRAISLDGHASELSSCRLAFEGETCAVTLESAGRAQTFACGDGTWAPGTLAVPALPETSRIAASGAWQDEQTFKARVLFSETPFARDLTWRFAADRVTLEVRENVSFAPIETLRLQGRLL